MLLTIRIRRRKSDLNKPVRSNKMIDSFRLQVHPLKHEFKKKHLTARRAAPLTILSGTTCPTVKFLSRDTYFHRYLEVIRGSARAGSSSIET